MPITMFANHGEKKTINDCQNDKLYYKFDIEKSIGGNFV